MGGILDDGAGMAQDVFISYRRQGSAFFAAKLRDRLDQSFPGQVFLDVSGIRAGDDFPTRLRTAVLAAKALVAVIGPDWLTSGGARVALEAENDFVAEEIGTALEAGIHVVPVLIEGASMPARESLPPRVRDLAQRHAVSISHERFDSDAQHLVQALYEPLGIEPPSKLERMLELAGTGRRFNRRLRENFALGSLVFTLLGGLAALQWVVVRRSDPLDLSTTLLLAAVALGLGVLGRHARDRRWLAIGGIVVSALTLTTALGMGVWRSLSLPLDPWLESTRVAQSRALDPAIPSEAIVWSPRVPFRAPLPSVECDCLEPAQPSASSRPFPQDAHLAFTNRCGGPVTFALARIADEKIDPVFAWIAGAGVDYAVVTLNPRQSVRVPLGGSHGARHQPWICNKGPSATPGGQRP